MLRMPTGFSQGDHICALYESEHEQLTTAAAYVAEGLAREERCYYVGQSPSALMRFREALAREETDVVDAPDLVDHALCAHMSVAIDGRHLVNPHYSPSLVVARRSASTSDLLNKVDELRRLA